MTRKGCFLLETKRGRVGSKGLSGRTTFWASLFLDISVWFQARITNILCSITGELLKLNVLIVLFKEDPSSLGKTTKSDCFSGRITTRGGGVTPLTTKQKNTFGKKEKNCQNPFQAILRLEKKKEKMAGTTKPLGGGGQNLSGPTTNKTLLLCVSSLTWAIFSMSDFAAKRLLVSPVNPARRLETSVFVFLLKK